MKRSLIITLVALMCLTFSGCGNGNSKVFDVLDENTRDKGPQNNSDSKEKEESQQAEEGAQVPEGNYGSMIDLAEEYLNNESFPEENSDVTSDLEFDTDKKDLSVDVDLTQMSSIMIYSEVYNMMTNPEAYIGKTIKIRGPYYTSYWEDTGKYYHFVIISDATACCSSGLEFIWEENSHKYPDEYPEDETEIELVGRFDSYEELGQTYYFLATDSLDY
ncbi:hypothetical protein [Lachnoclostridium phytofermentans]|uniref:Lipoprotein n=1 Tax=Lachnoclostridium phytofermentans (strain ATCC 700394 / DSM 18823 / ISDg) TaxID=357809 RepID=A9KHG1_LACP7|nr:hypothetical protein [Lachnoclostridium phytofermentans]ABX40828.1 hypothetical protein Cphy_0441 [Lachnoclostridium phytofermentans ISDg]